VLRSHAADVARVTLGRLLSHLRRGHGQPLWDVLLPTAAARIAAAAAATEAGDAAAVPEPAPAGSGKHRRDGGEAEAAAAAAAGEGAGGSGAAVRSAARAVGLVAQAVEYFRGSRVEDFGPILQLTQQLMTQQLLAAPPPAGGAAPTSRLPDQTLRLLLAVALAHTQMVGASGGLPALARRAPAAWGAAFEHAPAGPMLRLVAGLLAPPGRAELVALFAPQALAGVGRVAMQAGADPADQEQALALLVLLCQALRPTSVAGQGPPLLLTVPGGAALATHVRCLVGAACEPGAPRRALLAAWAGLQLLPHACESSQQALELARGVLAAARQGGEAPAPAGSGAADEEGGAQDALRMAAAATSVLAQLLPDLAPEQLPTAAAEALEWCLARAPADLATLRATAAMLAALRAAGVAAAGGQLGSAAMYAALPRLLPALEDGRQSVRGAALGLLCCFEQPGYVQEARPGAAQGVQGPAAIPCEVGGRAVLRAGQC
jgi:U3 small nucleolar RNA-associated protein 20